MGSYCCKDDSAYFKFSGKNIVRNRREKILKGVYKKYSKRKCYLCDKIKYGRYHEVVYGKEFICIDCYINRNKEEEQQLFKYAEKANNNI